MIKKIINKIADALGIKSYLLYLFRSEELKQELTSSNKKIFFFMIPNYGNLGDHAITIGSVIFFNDYFPDYDIIFIDLHDTYKCMKAVEKCITPSDVVVLQGGGNMGNLYQYIEDYRRFIIKHLKNYKIISMPVTCTFTDDAEGCKQLKKSQKIYQENTNFTIIAREKQSFANIQAYFPKCKAVLSPDIVFYLYNNLKPDAYQRYRIMLCLRSDAEKVADNRDDIVNYFVSNYNESFIYDTVIDRQITDIGREAEVESAIREFQSAKVVITDRMHAMVLAAITETPCVVMKSLDHKISGTYEWIKELPYIKMIDTFNIEDIKNAMGEVIGADSKEFHINYDFSKLKDEINCALES